MNLYDGTARGVGPLDTSTTRPGRHLDELVAALFPGGPSAAETCDMPTVELDGSRVAAERTVLAAVFREPLATLAQVGHELQEEAFTGPRRVLARAVLQRFRLEDQVAVDDVRRELERDGEAIALEELQSIVDSTGAPGATALPDVMESLVAAPDALDVDGLVRAADVAAEPVGWLWTGRIPRGSVTVLECDPSAGKTTLLVDLAARLSAGRPMPLDDGEEPARPVHSIIVSYEDALGVS